MDLKMFLCAPIVLALLCLASAQNNQGFANQGTSGLQAVNPSSFSNSFANQGTSSLPAVNPSSFNGLSNQGNNGGSLAVIPSGTGTSGTGSSGTGTSLTSASDLPLSQVGKCINSNINIVNANFITLASERNGYWVFSAVPATSEFDTLQWAHLHVQQTNTQNNYLISIYTQVQNEELRLRLQLLAVDSSPGVAIGSPSTGNGLTYKIFFTDYVQNRYAVVYICSDNVADVGSDYRYVWAHGWPLTNQERRNIYNKDKQNPFRGDLVLL